MDNVLVEKWNEVLVQENAPVVGDKEKFIQLLENQESYITETQTNASDIAQYTPMLVPAVRRVFPNLLANEIVGTQALKTPTSYVFALRYAYNPTGAEGIDSTDRGVVDNGTNARSLTESVGAVFSTVGILFADVTATFTINTVLTSNGVTGTVLYTEPGRALVKFATGANAKTACTPGSAVTGTGASSTTVIAGFQNEAGYNLIFKGYTGTFTTANSETLGAAMKTLKPRIEKLQVEAKSRRLKAEYTIELQQDMEKVYGMNAEKELLNIMEYEIQAELDRELVDLINAKATVVPTWYYGGTGVYSAPATGNVTADGRWEAEKIRTLYNRILREANQIALTTRRGSANFILASSNVVAALETLSGFMYASVPGQIKPNYGVAKVGTLDGKFNVYMDTFSFTDYVTLGYKGSAAMDSGIIYCPYTPLMIQKVVDPETFQPKIGFMTRDAIVGNLFGTQCYYRRMTVDFTGSSFAGGYFGNSVVTW